MGEGLNRTSEDIQVDMQSSPEQSCHRQEPMMGAELVLEDPRGEKGLGCKV